MKRGAENQLTKDAEDDDDITEVEPPQGFKKADDNVLASRPMRGLPKRGGGMHELPLPSTSSPFGMSTTSTSEKDTDPAPKFGNGFKGFGAESSTPFTFITSTPSASSSSLSMDQSSSDSPYKFSASATVSTSASAATKQFASFLGASSLPNGASSSSAVKRSASAEEKYHTSIRGLNVSFRNAVAKAIESDAFVDLTGALRNYTSLRESIQKEFDDSQKMRVDATVNGASSNQSSFDSKSSSDITMKPIPAPSLPTPPASFVGFGSFTPSTSGSTLSASQGGFTPTLKLGGPSSSSAFPFSTPPATSDKTHSSSLFSVPGAGFSGTAPSNFGSSEAASNPPSSSSTFAHTSPFGSVGGSLTNKPSTSLFGSGGVFGGSSSEGTVTSSKSSFGSAFSTNTTPATSVPATAGSSGFLMGGKPKGNLGNPVGFSFGSPTPTPEPEGSSGSQTPTPAIAASGSTPSAFPFGAQDSSATKASTPFSVDSRGGTPASAEGGDGDDSQKALGTNPHDEEGEGEEEEETAHTSRVKVYKLGKKDDKPHWAEAGVGMLRVKKHKSNGSKRLLSRNSATGKIMINFRLYAGLNPSRMKQVLSFVGHEDGNKVTYRVRLKDEAGAITLKEAIDKEVASL